MAKMTVAQVVEYAIVLMQPFTKMKANYVQFLSQNRNKTDARQSHVNFSNTPHDTIK